MACCVTGPGYPDKLTLFHQYLRSHFRYKMYLIVTEDVRLFIMKKNWRKNSLRYDRFFFSLHTNKNCQSFFESFSCFPFSIMTSDKYNISIP